MRELNETRNTEITVAYKVFLCGKLGKPASLQAIFSIFYGSEENTKTEDFFGRGGGGGGGVGGQRIKLYTDNIKYYCNLNTMDL